MISQKTKALWTFSIFFALDPPLKIKNSKFRLKTFFFFLALASARRVSELDGLLAEVRHSKGWTTMTFSLVPDFLAKTQRPGDESFGEFSIPALKEFVGDQEEDGLLCPVRAVREYLRRTKECHPSCS